MDSGGGKRRRLSNVRLTRAYHWRFTGLWTALTLIICLAFNVICYLLLEEPNSALFQLGPAELDAYLARRAAFLIGVGVEFVMISASVITLGCFTAHRLAGPYIRLCNVFNAVAGGDRSCRLSFRDYDKLDHVAKAFNDMMDAIHANPKNDKSSAQREAVPNDSSVA